MILRLLALSIAVAASVGCRKVDSTWMPLESDAKWSYFARGELSSALAEVSVIGDTAVGSVKGKQLSGDFGSSRFAWAGSRLIASQLGNTIYSPPLPLLDAGITAGQFSWSGAALVAGKNTKVAAKIRQSKVPYTIAQREADSLRTVVLLSGSGVQDELTTWFVQGLGIVKQERRAAGKLVLSLSLISGP